MLYQHHDEEEDGSQRGPSGAPDALAQEMTVAVQFRKHNSRRFVERFGLLSESNGFDVVSGSVEVHGDGVSVGEFVMQPKECHACRTQPRPDQPPELCLPRREVDLDVVADHGKDELLLPVVTNTITGSTECTPSPSLGADGALVQAAGSFSSSDCDGLRRTDVAWVSDLFSTSWSAAATMRPEVDADLIAVQSMKRVSDDPPEWTIEIRSLNQAGLLAYVASIVSDAGFDIRRGVFSNAADSPVISFVLTLQWEQAYAHSIGQSLTWHAQKASALASRPGLGEVAGLEEAENSQFPPMQGSVSHTDCNRSQQQQRRASQHRNGTELVLPLPPVGAVVPSAVVGETQGSTAGLLPISAESDGAPKLESSLGQRSATADGANCMAAEEARSLPKDSEFCPSSFFRVVHVDSGTVLFEQGNPDHPLYGAAMSPFLEPARSPSSPDANFEGDFFSDGNRSRTTSAGQQQEMSSNAGDGATTGLVADREAASSASLLPDVPDCTPPREGCSPLLGPMSTLQNPISKRDSQGSVLEAGGASTCGGVNVLNTTDLLSVDSSGAPNAEAWQLGNMSPLAEQLSLSRGHSSASSFHRVRTSRSMSRDSSWLNEQNATPRSNPSFRTDREDEDEEDPEFDMKVLIEPGDLSRGKQSAAASASASASSSVSAEGEAATGAGHVQRGRTTTLHADSVATLASSPKTVLPAQALPVRTLFRAPSPSSSSTAQRPEAADIGSGQPTRVIQTSVWAPSSESPGLGLQPNERELGEQEGLHSAPSLAESVGSQGELERSVYSAQDLLEAECPSGRWSNSSRRASHHRQSGTSSRRTRKGSARGGSCQTRISERPRDSTSAALHRSWTDGTAGNKKSSPPPIASQSHLGQTATTSGGGAGAGGASARRDHSSSRNGGRGSRCRRIFFAPSTQNVNELAAAELYRNLDFSSTSGVNTHVCTGLAGGSAHLERAFVSEDGSLEWREQVMASPDLQSVQGGVVQGALTGDNAAPGPLPAVEADPAKGAATGATSSWTTKHAPSKSLGTQTSTGTTLASSASSSASSAHSSSPQLSNLDPRREEPGDSSGSDTSRNVAAAEHRNSSGITQTVHRNLEKVEFENGDVYYGEVFNDKRHGHGEYTYARETRRKFEGQWKDNVKSGHGILYWMNGDCFVGNWKDNKRHGAGVLISSKGDAASLPTFKYEGEWDCDAQHGLGLEETSEGAYFGSFVRGRAAGLGIERRANSALTGLGFYLVDRREVDETSGNDSTELVTRKRTLIDTSTRLSELFRHLGVNLSKLQDYLDVTELLPPFYLLETLRIPSSCTTVLQRYLFKKLVRSMAEALRAVRNADALRCMGAKINPFLSAEQPIPGIRSIPEAEVKKGAFISKGGFGAVYQGTWNRKTAVGSTTRGSGAASCLSLRAAEVAPSAKAKQPEDVHPAGGVAPASSCFAGVADLLRRVAAVCGRGEENLNQAASHPPRTRPVASAFSVLASPCSALGRELSPTRTLTSRSAGRHDLYNPPQPQKKVKVALKQILPLARATSREEQLRIRKEFLKEVTVLAAIDHVNVVKFFGVCRLGADDFVVVEYCPQTLFELIHVRGHRGLAEAALLDCPEGCFAGMFGREKRVPPSVSRGRLLRGGSNLSASSSKPTASGAAAGTRINCAQKSTRNCFLDEKLRLVREICSAGEYLHSQGIVHADLKSPNILLSSAGEAKVCDFGHAAIRNNPRAHHKLGTPHWAAPEALRGENIGFPADVWSVGVIYWEVCHQRVPYRGLPFGSVIAAVGWGRQVLKPDENATSCEPRVLDTTLAIEAAQRATFHELADLLDDLLDASRSSCAEHPPDDLPPQALG